MKHKISTNISILAAFCGMLHMVSCTAPHNTTNTSTNDKITNEAPKIIFLNYSIVNDTIKQEYRIRLINKIITEGKIKENTIMAKTPVIDDLEYIVLNKESQVLMRNYIANPLHRTVEYVTDNGQLAKKDIQLDSTQFSLRIPLDPTAQYISMERYTGLNSDNIQVLIIDIFKNKQ
jgi:hypothetical protein